MRLQIVDKRMEGKRSGSVIERLAVAVRVSSQRREMQRPKPLKGGGGQF